jgi:hypothetical protein
MDRWEQLRPTPRDPGQALATIDVLLDALNREPRLLGQPEQVVQDLRELEAELIAAKDRGGRFYFRLGEGAYWSDPDWRRRLAGIKWYA